MTMGAIIFMALSWGFVLGVAGWSFSRMFRQKAHHDPDSLGPAAPPVPGKAERL